MSFVGRVFLYGWKPYVIIWLVCSSPCYGHMAHLCRLILTWHLLGRPGGGGGGGGVCSCRGTQPVNPKWFIKFYSKKYITLMKMGGGGQNMRVWVKKWVKNIKIYEKYNYFRKWVKNPIKMGGKNQVSVKILSKEIWAILNIWVKTAETFLNWAIFCVPPPLQGGISCLIRLLCLWSSNISGQFWADQYLSVIALNK